MTDAPKKTDEPAVVHVVAGPYAGQRLTMPKADADAAIADKWATDPNAPPPKEGEKEAKPMTEEEHAEVKAKAEKAARKLRGEPEPDAKSEDKAHRQEPVTRELGPGEPHTYQTRETGKK
jgi:hypothetical protein